MALWKVEWYINSSNSMMTEFLQFLLMIIISASIGGGAYYVAARNAPSKSQKEKERVSTRPVVLPAQHAMLRDGYDSEIKALKQEVNFWMSQYNLTLLEISEGKQATQAGLDAIDTLIAPVIAPTTVPDLAPVMAPVQESEDLINVKLSILAIWPAQDDLNLQASRDALYNAGVNYIALNGTVTMADIVDEFSRTGFNALELGTHGKRIEIAGSGLEGGVWLSDGIASPGWWARLAAFQKLKLAVVLACDSLQTGEALLHSGVENVVAVQGMIEDTAAVKFAFLFYKYIAAGKSIAIAFDLAKLALTRDQADILRLLSRQTKSAKL